MVDRRVSVVALLLLPAGLMAYFAFNAGGFFPASTAYVAMLLAVLLALRMAGSTRPFEGVNAWTLVAGGGLALLALLTLLSQAWSHDPALALLSFDQVLVYVLVMLLFGSLPHSRLRLVWILRGLAAAIFVVCGIALITRLLPHVWPTSPNVSNNRLSFPVTYWNVLGLLAVFGILLSLHFSSDTREPVPVRAAGALALPILAATLFFTFSRGSIAVCLVGLVLYVLIARPRGLLATLLTAAPATAIALKIAYDANLLATIHPTTAAAVRQGHHVAVVVSVCAVAAGAGRALLGVSLDRRLQQIRFEPRTRRRLAWVGWSTLAAAAVIAGIALNGKISHEYHAFLKPPATAGAADFRSRLTDPSNDGRVELWKVAWHEFKVKPLLGQGAGTFQNSFLQHRTTSQFVVNAHSLYLETLDELGIVGLILLLVAIVSMLLRTALRARGTNRPLYGVVFALIVVWALESGIDWDWQMPVVTIVIFSVGGFILARGAAAAATARPEMAGGARRSRFPSPPFRTALGLICLLLAVAPAYVWLSQRKLNQAVSTFGNGNWRTASDDALSSISILGIRPEAYELAAYADLHRDMPGLAIRAMRKAVSLDRDNWNYPYGLALMEAAGGENPLPAARRALALNPKEPLVQAEWQTFTSDTRSAWPADAKATADAFTGL